MTSAPQARSIANLRQQLDADRLGSEMYELMRELYPLCRSITGNGLRETLRIVSRAAPLDVHEIPSGTRVFDWVVPKEWNIKEAYIADRSGRRVIDFKNSNLHVLGYSTPIRRRVSRRELLEHVYSDPTHPDWIPYRNSYYKEHWAFCASEKQRAALTDDEYDVCIDSTLADGNLTYGEARLTGESDREVLISTHACHPSLCNDNLSGIVVAALLAKHLRAIRTRYTYRFVFLPCTIGPIVWLHRNRETTARIDHGLVLACLGDAGQVTYVRSRRDTAGIDRAMRHVLDQSGRPYEIRPFAPYGYDQRQYCSLGFNLPIGCLMRTPNEEYPEYHTSADNLELMRPQALADSFATILSTLGVLEDDRRYVSRVQHGEPHLGRRGLYDKAQEYGLFWLLNFSDGNHSVLDIAERSGVPFTKLAIGAKMLQDVELLAPHGTADIPR
jgi:aminopeptidase-like protein